MMSCTLWPSADTGGLRIGYRLIRYDATLKRNLSPMGAAEPRTAGIGPDSRKLDYFKESVAIGCLLEHLTRRVWIDTKVVPPRRGARFGPGASAQAGVEHYRRGLRQAAPVRIAPRVRVG
jgi:hypothetical protein